jgi:MFS family permease
VSDARGWGRGAPSASDRSRPAPGNALPTAYWWWLAGTALSLTGTQTLAFAMAWTAAADSALLVGLVLTLVNLPRAVLLLVGGATGDRLGAWRVLVACDATMLAATVGLALVLAVRGPSAELLLPTALVIGVIDAYYLPSSGSLPRRLVDPLELPRAMAGRQLAGQVAAFAGAGLGGILVAWSGLLAAVAFDALTFAFMLAVLLLIRQAVPEPRESSPAADRLWARAVDGLRIIWGDRPLRLAVLLAGSAAAFLLPVASLLLPVLARSRGWSPQTAGLLVGAFALGSAAVAVLVFRRGVLSRPHLAGPAGLLVAGLATSGLALTPSSAVALVLAASVGAGVGMFISHVGPMILSRTPPTHVSRVQAVLVLVQSVSMLASNNLLAGLADLLGPAAALLTSASVIFVLSTAALLSRSLRLAS